MTCRHRRKPRRTSALRRQHIRNGEAMDYGIPGKDFAPMVNADAEDASNGTSGLVTSHALLRYLERVENVDIEEIRRFLLSNGREATIKAMGAGRIHIQHHCTLIIRDSRVVTIVPAS